jgi:hypothetical protein
MADAALRAPNWRCARLTPGDRTPAQHADEHAQTSESPNMATAAPLGSPRAQTPQKQHAGLLKLDAQPSAASSRPPLRARRGRSLPWCGELTFRAPTRHRAPNQQPGRILIPATEQPGIRALRMGLPAGNGGCATPAACPVSTTSWRYGLRRTCRLVTGRSHRPRSTWPNQARLGFLAVTHRYERINCLRLEPFQIAE